LKYFGKVIIISSEIFNPIQDRGHYIVSPPPTLFKEGATKKKSFDFFAESHHQTFHVYLEFIHGKGNLCQFSCKNNNFSRNYGWAILAKTFYNLYILRHIGKTMLLKNRKEVKPKFSDLTICI